MKDRFEAKFYLFAVPALVVWEIIFQLVIARLFPEAADNTFIHGLGFVILLAVVWVAAKRIRERKETEDEED